MSRRKKNTDATEATKTTNRRGRKSRKATEPEVTEPEVTEPEATEPEATEPEGEQLTMADLRPLAKEAGVKIKGKTAEQVREEILDAVPKMVKTYKKEYGKKAKEVFEEEHSELLAFYDKCKAAAGAGSEKSEPTQADLDKAREKAQGAKTEATKKKAEKAEKKKAGGGGGPKGERTVFGRMPSSMCGTIDTMVTAGTTRKKIVNKLVKDFGRDEDKADKRLSDHLKQLRKEGHNITEDGKGNIVGEE